MRLIDAETLVLEVDCLETCTCRKAHGWMVPVNEVCRTIVEAPTIDAVPVVHGEWIKGQFMDSGLKCPFCGFVPYDPGGCEKFNYCPNCGAKMDGGKDDG